ncbi:protein rolling stone-like [Asterias rubens]|uniref:protein rolling stone-like n=1 Tax=Asterias rubens TaxID=7604 RepID=UPI0014559080|nr:protein rolling stone-like [Asterias rubens]
MACNGRLKLSDVWLIHKEPRLFATSQWPLHPFIFLAYRIFLALYLLVWLLLHISRTSPFGGFFVFLTNWTFTVLTIYAVSSCIGAVYFTLRTRNHRDVFDAPDENESQQLLPNNSQTTEDEPSSTDESTTDYIGAMPPLQDPRPAAPSFPHYFKFSWLLFNICLAVNPIVTVIFWVFLADPISNPLSSAINVHLHALNTVFIYLDLFISATPVRFIHFVYAILYGLMYTTFTLIYYWAGGLNPISGETGIYPHILDWANPGFTMLSIFAVIIIVPLTHLAGWGCFRIRGLSYVRFFAAPRNQLN